MKQRITHDERRAPKRVSEWITMDERETDIDFWTWFAAILLLVVFVIGIFIFITHP